MNLQRIQTIVDKEWAEVFKNRVVLLTVGLLPLLFTILPLGIFYAMQSTGDANLTGDSAEMPAQFMATCGNMGVMACTQLYIMNQFMILYMMLPMAIPVAIAAYSIVGEKTTRSLEPLLATPITTPELLAAKSIAAAIPAIVATWGAFIIFAVAARFLVANDTIANIALNPTWLVAIFIVGPLIAIMSVNFALIVSSRVSDPRVAEQVSMVIIVPLLGLLFGQIAGVIVLNSALLLSIAFVLVFIDIGLIYAGARLFERETILTKWR